MGSSKIEDRGIPLLRQRQSVARVGHPASVVNPWGEGRESGTEELVGWVRFFHAYSTDEKLLTCNSHSLHSLRKDRLEADAASISILADSLG